MQFTNEGCANCWLEGYDCTYPKKKVSNCIIYEKYMENHGICKTCEGVGFLWDDDLNAMTCPTCKSVIVDDKQ